MPRPAKIHYRVVRFESKALIFGGTRGGKSLSNVLEFDLTTSEFREMPPLPSGLKGMAIVRWGKEAVLLGGGDINDCYSKKVYMYNSKSGKTIELPPMLEERVGSCAIITGNDIVVMGGRRGQRRSRSVEAFTLRQYSWKYLPAMNDIRSVMTAVILPTRNNQH